jgi:hypothetical protein
MNDINIKDCNTEKNKHIKKKLNDKNEEIIINKDINKKKQYFEIKELIFNPDGVGIIYK